MHKGGGFSGLGNTTHLTWSAGEVVTAANMNTYISNNLSETFVATATVAGDICYADAANSLSRVGIGTANTALVVSGGAPTWDDYAHVRHEGTNKSHIERGAVDWTSDVAAGASFSTTVAMTRAFNNYPTPVGCLANTTGIYEVIITAVTSSGSFTVNAYNFSTTDSTGGRIYWLCFGPDT